MRAVEETEDNPQLDPAWSPDGNSIVFTISRSGALELATAAVGGGARPVILKEKVGPAAAKWSPKGNWILYRMPDSLNLISPDGKTDRVLSQQPWKLYEWSKEANKVYAIRVEKHHCTIVALDVPEGRERTLSEFDLPPEAKLGDTLSLAPDGTHLGTTLFHTRGDIWLLEGFRLPPSPLARLLPR